MAGVSSSMSYPARAYLKLVCLVGVRQPAYGVVDRVRKQPCADAPDDASALVRGLLDQVPGSTQAFELASG